MLCFVNTVHMELNSESFLSHFHLGLQNIRRSKAEIKISFTLFVPCTQISLSWNILNNYMQYRRSLQHLLDSFYPFTISTRNISPVNETTSVFCIRYTSPLLQINLTIMIKLAKASFLDELLSLI